MRLKWRRYSEGKPERPKVSRPATGDTFLIVVEGEATEVAYLNEVKIRLKRKAGAVLVHHGRHTDPVGIVREAIKLRDAQAAKPNSEAYDQVWVVFDREAPNHPRHKQVPAALKLAQASGIEVAVSVPSIEYWLFLHFDLTTKPFADCPAVVRALKKFIKDYEKADLPLDNLLKHVKTAMQHAARCHNHWEKVGGDDNPRTHMDKLMRALNESARADERLF
ncbi:MAG: RloB family protein [Chthoniobacter sp.]|nr:RloB family protein [Chthoniobacter sp.]